MTRTSASKAWIAAELRALATVQRSDRPWQMPLAGALAIGLPLLAGAWQQGHLQDAMLASIGGLVFLYVPNTPMSHRMVTLMTCAFAITTCFALGLLVALAPAGATLVIAAIAMIVTMVCRFYGVGPPGSLFFVMAPMLALTLPPDLGALPERVGTMALGAASACLIAFLYSLHTIRLRPPAPVVPPTSTFDVVVLDSVVIGAFVALAFVLAQALRLDKAYWVAVSCLAVIQGQTLRAVWTKQLHRVLGTALGLLIAAGLFQLPLDAWRIAGLVMLLAFVIEVTVVRHYGFAVAFITPLTILLAEAPTLGHMPVGALIHARFLDTVIGCAVGLFGGWCLHHPRFRARVGGWLRALVPRRFEHPQD